jgi:hypothetical protein
LRLLGEILQGKLSTWNKANRLFVGVLYPQATGAYVRLDVHRVESLSPGEAHDGLETPQQGQSGFGFDMLSRHALPPDPARAAFAPLARASSETPPAPQRSSGTGSSICSRA